MYVRLMKCMYTMAYERSRSKIKKSVPHFDIEQFQEGENIMLYLIRSFKIIYTSRR